MKVPRAVAVKELDVAIEWFMIKSYMNTVKWLNLIKQNIEEGNPSDFNHDIQDAFSGYAGDVKRKGGYQESCSSLIQSIYAGLLQKGVEIFRDTLVETHPFLVNWRVTQNNLMNITELTRNPAISNKARYYLYCFGYLIAVEGSYSNWIKILYRLVCQIEEIPDDSSTIEDWKPYTVQDKIIKIHPDFAILFEGYHRGNLRNAIGHGDFSYDDKDEKMHFKHIHKGITRFDEKWTFEEFYNNLIKIMTVTDTGIEIIFLLRLTSYKHLLPP